MNFRILIFLLFLIISQNIFSQSLWRKDLSLADVTICYASPEIRKSFIPPPAEFLYRTKSARHDSDIIVRYVGFPDSARVAFEYAVSIWKSLISSSVPIHIEARWQALGTNVLANCRLGDVMVNFEGAPQANVYYPIALAAKLMDRQVSGSGSPDMIVSFNSAISWYYNLDGDTPVSKYDLVSTALHEIAHGLGFTGLFYVNAARTLGLLGLGDGRPAIFDIYVQDFQRRSLLEQFYYPNPSASLLGAFTSNQLYSGSYLGARWNNGNRPRLYAPGTFNEGSSIYHLNTSTYPYGNANSLMTHSAGKGEAIHSPGPITLGILYDMGWKHLYIESDPVRDVENNEQPLSFRAKFTSELGLDSSSLYLVYSYDNFSTKPDSVAFTPDQEDGYFSAILQPLIQTGPIHYYLTATDTTGRDFYLPANAPAELLRIILGPDTIKPVVRHTPPTFILATDQIYFVKAVVTDNIGVDTVFLVVYSSGVEVGRVPMLQTEKDLFAAELVLKDYGLQDGGELEYRIIAKDFANIPNTMEAPEGGTYKVTVERIPSPVYGYFTDFNYGPDDFILGDFTIGNVKNFDSPALFSPNPYPSTEKDDITIDLITLLRIPVVVKGQGIISFDEVVLVEPGEPGTVFGDDEFWDYVILEGSSDYGKTWLPLIDGYDSRANSSWLTVYNSSISNQNSQAEGSRDLYINRQFSLTEKGNFQEGDTVLIRFRLFSDPYANGWGWAIDNLRIQQPVSVNIRDVLSPGHILFWPNPFSHTLNWRYSAEVPVSELEFEIFDLTGRLIQRNQVGNIYPGMSAQLPVSDIPSGFFIISVKADGLPVMRVKMFRQ